MKTPKKQTLETETGIHLLKIDPEHFDAVNYRCKTAELRKNDRNYKVGDMLILAEYDRDKKEYTDRKIPFTIKHITTHNDFEGLKEGYVMLSLGTLPSINEF